MTLLDRLRSIEWASYREGMGDGFMNSGPGPWVPACPACEGIDPNFRGRGRSDFSKSAFGHRQDCWLAKAIR